MNRKTNKVFLQTKHFLHKCICKLFLIMSVILFSQNYYAQSSHQKDAKGNDTLIDQYTQSKGAEIVVFDASNIKQFWINKSVVSRKGLFDIYLEKKLVYGSDLLKIQLINVNETQDCIVEVLTETPDVSFSVFDANKKMVSDSTSQSPFLHYNVLSSVFHLEDIISQVADNYSFSLKFFSPTSDCIKIKKIILSFSQNKEHHFLSSPGHLVITKECITDPTGLTAGKNNSFVLKGKGRVLPINKNIYISDNPITFSVKCENAGENNVTAYLQCELYSKNHKILGQENYPYKNTNKVLHVISAEKGSNEIIVDSYTDWTKNCIIAINAREDASDLPNRSLLDGKIVEIKRINDNQAIILLDKALSESIKKDTPIRVHGIIRHMFGLKVTNIQSEQTATLTHTIKPDKNSFVFSKDVIPKGVYYLKPIIILFGDQPTVLVSDAELTY